MRFDYTALPARVLFGRGRIAEVADEVRRLGAQRALVLSTPGHRALGGRIAALLGDVAADVYANATMHTPVDVTEDALATLQRVGADCTVAVGGGSTIGLGKALALRTDLPQLVLPTTYAGSEVTATVGETRDGVKKTQRSPRVLPRIVADPADVDARTEAQYAAWLCGTCMGATTMGLHHKVCHVLGGAFDLPHAQTHTVMLPHAVAYNFDAAPEAMRRIARALGATDAMAGLDTLCRALPVPRSLEAIGMPASGIDPATEIVMRDAYPNPRPLERAAIRDMLTRAFHGAGQRMTSGDAD